MNIKSKCRQISSCNAESETRKELLAVTLTPTGLGGRLHGWLAHVEFCAAMHYLENAGLLIYADLSSVSLYSVKNSHSLTSPIAPENL